MRENGSTNIGPSYVGRRKGKERIFLNSGLEGYVCYGTWEIREGGGGGKKVMRNVVLSLYGAVSPRRERMAFGKDHREFVPRKGRWV